MDSATGAGWPWTVALEELLAPSSLVFSRAGEGFLGRFAFFHDGYFEIFF